MSNMPALRASMGVVNDIRPRPDRPTPAGLPVWGPRGRGYFMTALSGLQPIVTIRGRFLFLGKAKTRTNLDLRRHATR
jgi:hypothetical protein